MRLLLSSIGQIAFLAGFSLLLATTAYSQAINNFTDVYVFGDSLIDAGNVEIANPGTAPAAGGYDGTGRFSNGPVFSDYITQGATGVLSSPSLAGGDNYGWGGARADDNSLIAPVDTIPDLQAQVGSYLTAAGGVADPNALYVLNAGGNDVRDIVLGGVAGLDRIPVINSIATSVATAVGGLYAAGADPGNVLVMNVPNVGLAPGFFGGGAIVQATATVAAAQVNGGVATGLASLPVMPMLFDTFTLSTSLFSNPGLWGLPGLVTFPDCQNALGGVPGGPAACNPFAFVDLLHPTTAVHQVVANEVIDYINFVPEPGTGLLLMIGLGGLSMRRRA